MPLPLSAPSSASRTDVRVILDSLTLAIAPVLGLLHQTCANSCSTVWERPGLQ